jgi:hypothetical protein
VLQEQLQVVLHMSSLMPLALWMLQAGSPLLLVLLVVVAVVVVVVAVVVVAVVAVGAVSPVVQPAMMWQQHKWGRGSLTAHQVLPQSCQPAAVST